VDRDFSFDLADCSADTKKKGNITYLTYLVDKKISLLSAKESSVAYQNVYTKERSRKMVSFNIERRSVSHYGNQNHFNEMSKSPVTV